MLNTDEPTADQVIRRKEMEEGIQKLIEELQVHKEND